MKLSILQYLKCPSCKGALKCEISREDLSLSWKEILEGVLTCKFCGKDYQIRDGVPRMFTIEQHGAVDATVSGFGWQWLTFDRQIQDTYMTGKELFLDFIHPIDEGFFRDKVVLDAGCGMGRFLTWGASFGSREIIGVDLSDSVDAAYRNTRDKPNAHVVQADIMALPFDDIFDYVYSVGVLHHMAAPKEGFIRLVSLLKHEGKISAWVYGRENNEWVVRVLSPLRKYVTSWLPRPLLLLLSYVLGLFLYTLLQSVYKPINDRKPEWGRFLPYNVYLYYTSRLPFTALVNVIFDHLVPRLAAYISKEEFEDWFSRVDLVDVEISPRNNMSWRGLGTRFASAEEVV